MIFIFYKTEKLIQLQNLNFLKVLWYAGIREFLSEQKYRCRPSTIPYLQIILFLQYVQNI